MDGQVVPGRPSKGRSPRRNLPLEVPTGGSDADDLRVKVRELEGRVRALTISRRVLITLLVSADKKRKVEVMRLRAEVEKLRDRAHRTNRAITTRDAAIHRLRCRLAELAGQTVPSDPDDPIASGTAGAPRLRPLRLARSEPAPKADAKGR